MKYRKLSKVDSMILRIMSKYLNSCDENDFDNIEHIIQNLATKYNADKHLSMCAIQESQFWTWLIPDEYIVEFSFD